MNIGETLYVREKTKGGRVRYIPICERLPTDTFGPGAWIVRVNPGVTSTVKAVFPDKPGLSAAIEIVRDAMLGALYKAWKTNKTPWDVIDAGLNVLKENNGQENHRS